MQCKKCGHNDFAYVETHKKGIKWYITTLIIIGVTLACSMCYTYDIQPAFSIIAVLGMIYFIFAIIYGKIRRKQLHTKCICKNCRNVTFID